MKRRLAAALVVLAGCGGGNDEPARTEAAPPQAGTAADRRAAAAFPGYYRDSELGWSFAYPASWRYPQGPEPGSPILLTGPSGGSCIVAPAEALPDWTNGELRVAYVLRGVEELRGAAGVDTLSSGVVRGANAEGAGAAVELRTRGRTRRTRNAVLASAGSGVVVSCEAPVDSFARLDRTVFRPLVASVRIVRQPALEAAQSAVAATDGVRGASLRRGRRGRIEALVEPQEPEEAEKVVQAALRTLVREFPRTPITVRGARSSDASDPRSGSPR